MFGAVLRQLAQHLFTDRDYLIELRCRRYEFANLLLLFASQGSAPLR
jgi:hypothetical protein